MHTCAAEICDHGCRREGESVNNFFAMSAGVKSAAATAATGINAEMARTVAMQIKINRFILPSLKL